MEKRRKNEAINGESHLPQPLIQHIQSFLNAKQAARTTVLSKPWRKAWLNRPKLDFDETHFPRMYCEEISELFWIFAMKTIQRYEESNLKIESIRIYLEKKPCHDFVKKLIVKALKMGATHVIIRLQFGLENFVIPPDVFGSENLVGLSLEGCIIDPTTIRCSRLKSLSLTMVDVKGTDGISNIISSCPLIEELTLYLIFGSNRHININHKLDKLKFLKVCKLEIDPLFFSDLSSKFPNLKELALELSYSREDILVSSHSLERLSYSQDFSMKTVESRRVWYDVPNIRKFTFKGSSIPLVSFKSASRGWESRLSLFTYTDQGLSTLWFCELNKLLTELKSSSVHLSINYYNKASFDYDAGVLEDLPRPLVENLTMEIDYLPSLTSYAIFDGLFRACRPKIITQDVPQESSFGNNFLCKALVRGMDEKLAMHGHCLYGLHEVEEVSVQLFDEVGVVWRDLPWKTILDASASEKCKQKMRFQLKWKP